jgi:hypothetical protein
MASRGWRMNFRRWLNERAQNQLRQMRDILATCVVSNERDRAICVWENQENFMSNPCTITFSAGR